MKEYLGGCHCGEIKFKFYSEESVEVWKCNCSICKMLDYEHLFIEHDDFKIIKGKELLSKYSFCKDCGIKSFYQSRSHPDSYSINLKCVEDPPEIKNIVNFDGKNKFTWNVDT